MRLAEDMLKYKLIPAKDLIYYGGSHQKESRSGMKRGELDGVREVNKAFAKRKVRILLKTKEVDNVREKMDKKGNKKPRSSSQVIACS